MNTTPKLDHYDIDVTPGIAAEFLLRNHNNRPVKDSRVAQFADMMSRGEWPYTGEAIKFDTNGDLLDGQHRLLAIVRSGVVLKMHVIYGLPREHQLYMDLGTKRTAGDQLGMQLGMLNGNRVAALARLVMRWEAGTVLSGNALVSVPDVVHWVSGRQDAVQRAGLLSERVYRVVRGRCSVIGAVAYRTAQKHPYESERFFTRLATGADLTVGDPEHTLRETMLRRRDDHRTGTMSEVAELHAYVRMWNLAHAGKKIVKIQQPKGGITLADLSIS